ncbi:DUF3530 domain-containing protein [Sesbania bispinosa]|nr:DUF3530 domain-containing protein [Sesbania bispinosa]
MSGEKEFGVVVEESPGVSTNLLKIVVSPVSLGSMTQQKLYAQLALEKGKLRLEGHRMCNSGVL